jgi:hypothetical protein
MNNVACTWNDWAEALKQGRLDLDAMRKLSKIWRKLEACEMWPPSPKRNRWDL